MQEGGCQTCLEKYIFWFDVPVCTVHCMQVLHHTTHLPSMQVLHPHLSLQVLHHNAQLPWASASGHPFETKCHVGPLTPPPDLVHDAPSQPIPQASILCCHSLPPITQPQGL